MMIWTVSAQSEDIEWDHYFSSNILHKLYCGGDYVWSFRPAHVNGLLQFDPERETFNHFHAGNGTLGNRIIGMDTDANDTIWCLTDGGLVWFDGFAWHSVETPENIEWHNVMSFTTGKNGTVWIGGYCVVGKYDGTNWETFTTSDGIPSNHIQHFISDSAGNVMCADWYKIYTFDGESWQPLENNELLEGEGINFLNFDKNDTLWCGTGYGKLSFYNGESWETLQENIIVEVGCVIPEESVEEIIVDSRGYIWCRMNTGLKYYDGEKWIIIFSSGVYDLCIDLADNVYCATNGEGIFKYDGSSWTSFTSENGLTTNNVRSLCVDDEGVVWCGLYYSDVNGDISRFDGVDRWETFKHENGLLNSAAFNIFENEGEIWSSTGDIWPSFKGILRFDGQGWQKFPDEMLPDGVTGIMPESNIDGLFYFIYNNKLYFRNNGMWSNIPFKGIFELSYIEAICIDHSGNVWVGGDSISHRELVTRVARYDGSWTKFTVNDGFDGSQIQHLYTDSKGMVWCTSTDGPVGKYDGSEWTWYTSEDGLAGERIREFGEDAEGNIYGGEIGLCMYDGSKWNRIQAPGEPVCGVYSIHVEENGNVWLATAGLGLGFFDGISWKMYTTEDGLCSNWIYTVFIDSNDNLWRGTDVGISVLKRNDGTISSIDSIQNYEIPLFEMSQPTPNPFNPITTISYTLPQSTNVTLSIYNTSGQRVSILKDEYQQAGSYSATWNATGFPSGLYFAVIEAGGFRESRKMVLVK